MHRASLLRIALLAAGAALLGASCHGASYPMVDCHQAIWVTATEGATVTVLGSWDGWQVPGVAAQPSGYSGWQMALLDLPAGEYGYQIVKDGVVGIDPYQPLTTFRGEEEVSLLLAPDCATPAIQIDTAAADARGALTLTGTFLAAAGGPALDPASVRATIDGVAADAHVTAIPASGAFTLAAEGLARGKHTVTVSAAGAGGAAAPDARASVWVQPAAETWDDAVLYQIVTDRFRGDGGATLAPPPTPGARAGGTLDGITSEIERGTFAELGVTALWISPSTPTRPARSATATATPRRATTATGRSRTSRSSRASAARPRWTRWSPRPTPAACACSSISSPTTSSRRTRATWPTGTTAGSTTAPRPASAAPRAATGAPYLETCWFTPYLPSARFQDDGTMTASVDDALFWMSRFDADGVRIDAVPMMPRAAMRRIVRALRDSEAPARALFGVGEIFTGGGEAGLDQIKYFLGPNGLDSAFDFPLMWAMRDVIADDSAGFAEIEGILSETERALAGSGAVPARMLDNHDVSRFISEADGNGADDPWSSPPPQPTNPSTYARQRMALGLIFTLPGMPVIYYGDEVGLAGANDPDSRRVMPALSGLPAEQAATLALTRRLGVLRRCSTALRRGARVPIWHDATTYAFARDAGDGAPALALFSRAQGSGLGDDPGGRRPRRRLGGRRDRRARHARRGDDDPARSPLVQDPRPGVEPVPSLTRKMATTSFERFQRPMRRVK